MGKLLFKLNLQDYNLPEVKGVDKAREYTVKRVIHSIVLHPQQNYNGFRFYTVSKIAKKIEDCKEPFIILDHTEYTIVKTAFDNFKGFGPADQELVRRIYEAEEVKEEGAV